MKNFITAHTNVAAFAVFATLIAVFYGSTLRNGFVLDDRKVIEENVYVHSLQYLPKVLTGCIWEYTHGACAGKTLHYRPMHSLSYLLTWQISSSPWFFHLVNLLYFLAIVSLVFTFARLLTKNFLFAFFSSIIFLVHPINSEVVNWVSAVSELSFVLFALLTLIFYVRSRSQKNGRRDKNLFFAILCFFFAMLSKEVAVFIIPPLLVALDLLILRIPLKKLLLFKEIKRYLLFAVPFLVYFVMRIAVLGGFGGLTSTADYLGGFTFTQRVDAFLKLFLYSAKEILYPYPLSFFHEVRIETNLLNVGSLLALLACLVFLSLVYIFIKRKKHILAFSLIWFFVFFSPLLILFNIAGENNHFFERYLFGSSIGFSFFAGFLLSSLWSLWHQKRAPAAVLLLLGIVVFAAFAVVFPRNKVWANNLTLLQTTLEQKPHAVAIREFLAYELEAAGDAEAAKREYEIIVEQGTGYRGLPHALNNLGNYYRKKQDFEKAEEYFKKSLEAGQNAQSYNNLGALQVEKGEHLKALVNFCKALQIDPDAPEAKQNYNNIVSSVYGVEDSEFLFLYLDVMQGGAFQPSSEKKILFKKMTCAYGSCFYTFQPQLEEREVLFPFLIMATAFPQEGLRLEKFDFNPSTNEITLVVPEQYKDRLLTFTFPACSGLRYETQVNPS